MVLTRKRAALLDLPVLLSWVQGLNSHTQANSLGVAFSIFISVSTKTAILNLKVIQAL